MKLISIIIPVYNGENFIKQCLQNISKCTMNEIEFIFIDDGSKDRTRNFIETEIENDSRIRYFYQENSGVSAARNLGISYSEGKYIGFLDVDDSFEPELYTHLYEQMETYSLDLVISGIKTNDGNVLIKKDIHLETDTQYSLNEEFLSKFMLCEINGSPWNKLYRSDIIKSKLISFDKKIPIGEDYLFILNYLSYCRSIRYTEKYYYLYNIRPNSAMTSYNKDKYKIYKNLQMKCLSSLQNLDEESINYQNLRYLVWINNCFIDEVNLNPSKSNRRQNISVILSDAYNKEIKEKLLKSGLKMGIKFKVILFLLRIKSISIVELYGNVRKLMIKLLK